MNRLLSSQLCRSRVGAPVGIVLGAGALWCGTVLAEESDGAEGSIRGGASRHFQLNQQNRDNLCSAEAIIRNMAVSTYERNRSEEEKRAILSQLQDGIRSTAVTLHQRSQQEEERKRNVSQVEESIQKMAWSHMIAEQQAQKAKECSSAVEHMLVDEAKSAFLAETPTPKIDLHTEKLREALSQKAIEELEVFEKWRKHIDEATQENLSRIEAEYDLRLAEIERLYEEKFDYGVGKERAYIQKSYAKKVDEITEKYQQLLEKEKNAHNTNLLRVKAQVAERLEEMKKQEYGDRKLFEDTVNRSLDEMRSYMKDSENDSTERFRGTIKDIQEQDAAYHQLSQEFKSQQQKLALSLSAITLSRMVTSGSPYSDVLQDLERHSSLLETSDPDDPDLLPSLLTMIKPTATTGVPTLMDLQARFSTVLDTAFRDSLMGDDVSFLSFFKSKILGNALVRKKGLVEGNTPEDVLARSEYYLARGNLELSVRELEELKGPASVTIRPWLEAAKERLSVLITLEVIETYIRLSLEFAAVSDLSEWE
eukprot:CAMPEP_0201478708 /NCGR_PEP_ID=MMETSP0151_2-20130828/3489_1 /ASSEMBLY_ACC=CAM_ASM_000257 /TAXON_ID=200890 /ORGANISM="Paramoeba atlantica, Strain 621/1 / CCAP 1560/9" /LENGTH=536 /DNA_ID=CAMNT_0047859873 /DNA_START=5 /DNA_END=1615 /DNA_ORIENTATION=-